MEDGGREEPYAVFPTKPRSPLVVFLFVVVLFVFMLLFVLFFFVFLVVVESKGSGARSERQNEGNHDRLHSCVLSPNPNLVAAFTAQEAYRVQTGILEDRLSTIYCTNRGTEDKARLNGVKISRITTPDSIQGWRSVEPRPGRAAMAD